MRREPRFSELRQLLRDCVAEREGFEPSVPSRARRISSAVHSTTLPPLREGIALGRAGCSGPGAGRERRA